MNKPTILTQPADGLKRHLEANLLDGDAVQPGQMIASTEVLEWARDYLAAHNRLLAQQMRELKSDDSRVQSKHS